jgi:hypothetical protein
MNGGARDILQERKKMKDREIYDGHWDEIRRIFSVWADIFHLIFNELKADITKWKTKQKTRHQTKPAILSQHSCVSRSLPARQVTHPTFQKPVRITEFRTTQSRKRHCVIKTNALRDS